MKDYQFFEQLLLRTPAYSHTGYVNTNMVELCRSDWFRSAILLASKSFFMELDKKDFDYEKLSKKQQLSLQKYLNRMCYRCTPFGLFAGFTTVGWQKGTSNIILDRENARLHSRLDQQLSQRLSELLRTTLKPFTSYRANPSLYPVNQEFRYYKWQKPEGATRFDFTLQAFERNPFIRRILTYCKRQKPERILLDFIIKETSCGMEEARRFLDLLISRQVLTGSFDSSITGTDHADILIDECTKRGITDQETTTAATIADLAHRNSLPNSRTQELLISGLLKLGISETKTGGVYYSGLERLDPTATLDSNLADEIMAAINCLDKLTPPPGKIHSLEKFVVSFKRKFENRVVPLLAALDPEAGIDYTETDVQDTDEDLLETVSFQRKSIVGERIEWTGAHRLLMRLWKQYHPGDKRGSIEINDSDLAQLNMADDNPVYPAGMSVMFRLANGQIQLEQATGPSAIALSARFGFFSNQVEQLCAEVAALEQEANPQVIFAEIAHLSNEHADNINRRPTLFNYEIPVLCNSFLPEERQIQLSDLYVNIRENEVWLYSARLKKRVIPRLSSAFNFPKNDLPVFRFLCDLQYQGLKNSFALNMEELFPGLTYYPRVTYKSTILYMASWYPDSREFSSLIHASTDQMPKAFKQVAEKLSLPRYFSIKKHDQQLAFDSENQGDIRLFIEMIKVDPAIAIREFIADQSGIVQDETGAPYVNQFVGHLYRKTEIYKSHFPELVRSPFVKRKFAPGSEWLYLKIYCHPRKSNELIYRDLLPAVRSSGKNSQWFFVRYGDPDYHIRLRIKIDPSLTGSILPLLEKKLARHMHAEQIEKFQADTYLRELERYNNQLIDYAEDTFYRSSELIASFVGLAEKQKLHHPYFTFALQSVYQVMSTLFGDAAEVQNFTEQCFEALLQEYDNQKEIRFQLDQKYRKLRKTIESALFDTHYLSDLRLASKSRQLAESIRTLKIKATSIAPSERLKLYLDLLHMHMNRIFTFDAKKKEMAVYYFLLKFCISTAKRTNEI